MKDFSLGSLSTIAPKSTYPRFYSKAQCPQLSHRGSLPALLNPTQCLIEDGKELVRVCIIVVYDKLVKTTQTRPHKVMFSLRLSSRCKLPTHHVDGQPSSKDPSPWPQRSSPRSKPNSSPTPRWPHLPPRRSLPRVRPQNPPDLQLPPLSHLRTCSDRVYRVTRSPFGMADIDMTHDLSLG